MLNQLPLRIVCPIEIPTQRAISKMNRKSVWRIWQLLNLD
jgi:succinate dehydrogenase / fumarate reductase iron-sulfur subunit